MRNNREFRCKVVDIYFDLMEMDIEERINELYDLLELLYKVCDEEI